MLRLKVSFNFHIAKDKFQNYVYVSYGWSRSIIFLKFTYKWAKYRVHHKEPTFNQLSQVE